MSESTDLDLLLLRKRHTRSYSVENYPISERTSNGSFVIDEQKDGQVMEVHEMHSAVIEEEQTN